MRIFCFEVIHLSEKRKKLLLALALVFAFNMLAITLATRDALGGSDPSGGALYCFNPATATSAWIWSRPLIVTIGNHRFCA